jgi:hypothetical protein
MRHNGIIANGLITFSLALFFSGASASAATVFNTGVDSSGNLLALGDVDSNFLLFPSTCCGSGLTVNAFSSTFLSDGAYPGASPLENTATAQWIGYTGFGPYWATGSNATAAFSETFTLTDADIAAGNLDISGMLGLTGTFDEILLNSTVDTADGFAPDYGQSLHSFNLSTGFVAGTNTISFVESWTDAEASEFGKSSEGVIVDDLSLSGGAAPEPGTFVLLGASLVAIRLIRRRVKLPATA